MNIQIYAEVLEQCHFQSHFMHMYASINLKYKLFLLNFYNFKKMNFIV